MSEDNDDDGVGVFGAVILLSLGLAACFASIKVMLLAWNWLVN